jgi:hypothetical protein
MPLVFNADHLPAPIPEYVAWVDVMGTQASMSRSLKVTANFIFKLHTAALQAPHANVRVYPVMDGFYAAAVDQAHMLSFLRSVFVAAAEEFNGTANNYYRFVVRGALAYGPVIHGNAIPNAASQVLGGHAAYRDLILLGMPIVQAHLGEASAPPFGVYVHESARAFAPAGAEPLHHAWWQWHNAGTQAIWNGLMDNLNAYFDWCAQRSLRIGYPSDRIAVHREMARQFFA